MSRRTLKPKLNGIGRRKRRAQAGLGNEQAHADILPAWLPAEMVDVKGITADFLWAIRELDDALLPEVAEFLKALLLPRSVEERFIARDKAMRSLQATFPVCVHADQDIRNANVDISGVLSDDDNPEWRTVGSTQIDWGRFLGVCDHKKTQSYQGMVQAGCTLPFASLMASLDVALFVNVIISRAHGVMTEAFNLLLWEATLSGQDLLRRVNGDEPFSKEKVIEAMIRSYGDGLRKRLNYGKKGKHSLTGPHSMEIKTAIRSWQGETPSQQAFAITLPSIKSDLGITSDLLGAKKREKHKLAYDRFRHRLMSCRKAGLLPKKSWRAMFTELRTGK
jgi:hypothetical protein